MRKKLRKKDRKGTGAIPGQEVSLGKKKISDRTLRRIKEGKLPPTNQWEGGKHGKNKKL